MLFDKLDDLLVPEAGQCRLLVQIRHHFSGLLQHTHGTCDQIRLFQDNDRFRGKLLRCSGSHPHQMDDPFAVFPFIHN